MIRNIVTLLPLLLGLLFAAGPAAADVMDDANDGVRAHENGQFEKAMFHYTRGIDSGELPEGDNLLSYLHNNRGLLYVKRHEYDKAMADFNEALRHKPDFVFFFNRGRLFMHLEDDQQAIADFTQCLMRNPDFIRAFHARGLAKLNTGDIQGGLADLRQAKLHFPFLKTRTD